MRESAIEGAVSRYLESKGGKAVKITTRRGFPDKLLLLPPGKFCFCEFKTAKGRLSARQELSIKWLFEGDFPVALVRTVAEGKALIDHYLVQANPWPARPPIHNSEVRDE